ncbi:Small auxin-up RNA protein [Dioscorea alata]|uniref:Small auxin-up RNA protein n=1 Tax=Dioscorea alata TaxID=55571 RepID=A0ACB7V8K9_DIOAL|nr:Small auxin-up RNA protein [Dioscorea alata]
MFGSGRFLRTFLRKWRKLNTELLSSAKTNEYCWWVILSRSAEDEAIPRDVPKGHMVVYVGEARKRFVIRVSFLEHPLFRALLDEAQEKYDFNCDSKLCIPCDENSFLGVLRFVRSQQSTTKLCLCF